MEYAIAKTGGTFLLFGSVLAVAGVALVVWQNFNTPTISSMPSFPSNPAVRTRTSTTQLLRWLIAFFSRAGFGTDALNLVIISTTICLFIAGIFTLAISASTCSSNSNGPRYEPFDNKAASSNPVLEIQSRTEKLEAIKDRLEHDLEDLSTSADDVCAILKQVEDTYITNASAPTSIDEMNLAPDIQERRKADRKTRAATSFKDRMKQYVDLNGGKPLYECFESTSDTTLATAKLQEAVKETTMLMNTGEVKLASMKEERIRSLMGFTASFLKKTIDTLTGVKEGFEDSPLTGNALIQKADQLIAQAADLHRRVIALKKDVEIQRKASAGLDAKAANLSEGNFSQVDVNAAMP